MPYPLPAGYDTDTGVGFAMLIDSMNRRGLTAIGVQNRGQSIVDALNQDYPDLHVYLSPTDSPVWPRFGSLDVTVDSGRGGFSFRPDGYFPYEPSQYVPPPNAGTDPPPAPPRPDPMVPPSSDLAGLLWRIENRLAGLEASVQALRDLQAARETEDAQRYVELIDTIDLLQRSIPTTQPDYTGTVKLPWLKTVTFTLSPVPVS